MNSIDMLTDKIFLKKWRMKDLSSEETIFLLALVDDYPKLTTKSLLGHKKWPHKKLAAFITTQGIPLNENWLIKDTDQHLLVWQVDRPISSPPNAIMSFNINVTDKTRTNRASRICIENNLMWVNPKYRRQGFGYHLATHFLLYLLECKIYYPYVSQRGVEVIYYADYYTEGGEHLSEYICEFLCYMNECWQSQDYKELDDVENFWPIRELDIDVDDVY